MNTSEQYDPNPHPVSTRVLIESLSETFVGCQRIARTHTCFESSLVVTAATADSTSRADAGLNLRRFNWFPRRSSSGARLQALLSESSSVALVATDKPSMSPPYAANIAPLASSS